MSLQARLIDAKMLYANGRYEGALLMVLVTIAATARKRYPKEKWSDNKSFRKFFKEELSKRLPFKSLSILCDGKQEFIEDLFYTYMRCNLVHEAELAPQIKFEPGEAITMGGGDQFVFTHGWLDLLASIVEQAPENANEFSI